MFFVAFKVWITINVWFYTVDEKLCKYENVFNEKYKDQEKSIQSGTPVQHTKNRDCPGKIETVECSQKQVTTNMTWNPVKYLNVLHHNRTQYFFLI